LKTNRRSEWRCGVREILALVMLLVSVGVLVAQTAPEESAASLVDIGWTLRARAADEAREGELDAVACTLEEALALDPEDPRSLAGLVLLDEYEALTVASQAQQAEELEGLIARIERYLLAQAYRNAHPEDETVASLQESVDDLLDIYDGGASLASALESATPEEAEALRETTLVALAETVETVEELEGELTDQEGDYFALLAEIAGELIEELDALSAAWSACDFSTSVSVYRAANDLRPIERAMAERMVDMDVMLSEDPWKMSLSMASVARKLLVDDVEPSSLEWYGRVVADAEQRGEALMAEAEWTDAMIAYGGLEGLDRMDPEYRKMAKIVGRHVRAERFYGHPEADEEGEDAPEPFDWDDFANNVDARMVRKIIARIDSFYVMPVDYTKLIDHSISSLRVLAETPQAADSFPNLGDEELRDAFTARLDAISEHFHAKEGPLTHLDLVLTLNRVMTASSETVVLPRNVIAVEFADGFLSALDPHTSAIWPSAVVQFEKATRGHFTGVGIQVDKKPGESLHVVTPMAGTPAYKAGIRMDDYITKVDGKETADMELDRIIDRISGAKGTEVVLTIRRKGVAKPFDLPVVRDTIMIDTIKGWQLEEGGEWDFVLDAENKIGYIRLTRFTEDTLDDLRVALKELKDQGVESLVLDLRFNPGGLLGQAHGVVDQFVPGGQVVMTQGRQVKAGALSARKGGLFTEGELVVLIDEYSASASEIVSGALKDLGRATIIGDRSYGKGSVQQVLMLGHEDSESYLKVTSAYYYVGPSEILVHRRNGEEVWGVDPHVSVTMSSRQTQNWLDVRRRTDLVHEDVPETLAEDLDAQLEADIQLQTALLMLRLERTLTTDADVTDVAADDDGEQVADVAPNEDTTHPAAE
jgi:carboxyl-terminal processing protease